jgi:hypothetical protein
VGKSGDAGGVGLATEVTGRNKQTAHVPNIGDATIIKYMETNWVVSFSFLKKEF